MTEIEQNSALLGLTADIVSAHVKNNPVQTADLPALIGQVYAALRDAGSPTVATAAPARQDADRAAPVVSPRKSIFPDYIICLEDGRKLKTLKRYLRSTYNLTPEQYREKWDLPADYPMVAPNYAEHRSNLAKKLGLGRKPAAAALQPDSPELPLHQPAAEAPLAFAPERAAPPAPARASERSPERARDPAFDRPREPERAAPPVREHRPDHTAASVFAKFPTSQDAVAEQPGPSTLDGGKTRRKPFSKQLARTMRP